MKFYILFLSILLVSCNKNEKREITKSTNSVSYFREKFYNEKLMDSLNNLALSKGDTIAYNELKAIYFIGGNRFSVFLYHALIMSNKYNYKPASRDVYEILTSNNKILDEKTRKMANEYLLKSKK